MTLLEVSGLKTQFNTSEGIVRAVNNVDLSIETGQLVGLVGESGSGKSVLAKSLMGLIDDPGEIVEGDILFNGKSLLNKTEAEMQSVRGGEIAMIFQDPMNSLNPVISVGEQIAESVRLHQSLGEPVSLSSEVRRKILGSSKNSDSWRKAIEMLEAGGIPDPSSRANDYPHQFSGGMRQRAMIAMALAGEPDLLVADEPTTALDVTIQAQILAELENVIKDFNMSVLLITHDLAVVAETCSHVNVMYAGKIIERGTTEDVFENPQHPYTEGLLASTPRIDSMPDRLDAIPGNVPELIDLGETCFFAPRCPEATEDCVQSVPQFRTVGPNKHSAACIHREPIDWGEPNE